MALVEFLIITATILFIIYKWGTRNYDHWKNQGVPYLKPKIPIFGNTLGFMTRKFHPADGTKWFYDSFPNEKLGGIFGMNQPWLIARDPEVFKTIMIKDFDHFTDRNPLGTTDPEMLLLGKDLLSLRGQEWREMRNTMSPAFTAAKLKTIFDFVNKCGEQLTDYIENEIKNNESGEKLIEEDFKSLFTRFSNDVIATAGFGVQVDSLKDKDNEFYQHAMNTIDFGFVALVKFMTIIICPKIMKMLDIGIFPGNTRKFFTNLIISSVKLREENKLVRHDLLHLMLEAKKQALEAKDDDPKAKKAVLSDMDIATNAMLFFFAGFETISTALCFMVYELAVHQEVQSRLRNEIDDVLKGNNGKITYDAVINQMKYLDMVVSESLRKWPPMFTSERQVSKPYTFHLEGCPEAKLRVRDMVLIPIYAIHRDPQNWPEPDKFDPERFSEHNKQNIAPYTYMPFGAGPRSCIGNRFALMETKMCLVHLIRKFVILPTEKTTTPGKLDRKNVAALALEGGFRFKIKLRDDVQE